MWLRFLAISILHWVFALVMSALLAMYILSGFTGYALAIPMWLMNFLLSFGFASWAFHKKLPGSRDVAKMLVIWFVVMASLQAAFEIMQYGTVYFLIRDIQLHIQYFLDLFAILLAAYLTRRWKVKAVLGEGMVE
jgi:hypothetical protein